jgi:hypothetical protein
VSEVRFGVRTSSFRGLPRVPDADPIQTLIEALGACGVRDCELCAPQVEAQFGAAHAGHHTKAKMSPQMMRRELRKWRLRTPASYFRAIGDRFRSADIAVHAYAYDSDPSFTDEEIDYGFTAAKALGAAILTASTTLDVAARIAPFADRHRMVVALGGDPRDDPHALGTPPRVGAAMNMSTYFRISLDIGRFTAANLDAVAYLRDHHAAIATLLLKDRRRNHGDAVPWGQGDAPIREALQLIAREAWSIRASVDYDYASRNRAIDEVKKCLAYAAQALA